MSVLDKNLSCKDVAPLLVFYVCDEVSEKERKQIEAHLEICSPCSVQLAEERELQKAMVAAPQPADELDSSGILLAQCRSELAEALDDLSAPAAREHWRPLDWLRRWMALRPAWSGAVLVMFGVLLGAQLIPWLQSSRNNNANLQTVNVVARQPLTPEQLAKMDVAGINFSTPSGSGPGTVQLRLSAEQPLELSGNVNDSDMQQVLTYVVENGERFDAGVRLDCLDALKAAVRNQEVRRALMAAARKDQNPAVRMKALESLRGEAADDAVRQVLLDALQHDANPGVRVEAVNVLVGSLEHGPSDISRLAPGVPPVSPAMQADAPEEVQAVERVILVLQQLQHRDPDRYVRLRSAAALRQIGPREVQ
ncbi:MAG TPA: HEAT repeat domain-containing protein [Candidatus Udaeobacter sp.]|nr:HEAT repeat domain-containing protein [Candidatus Udaeobacter sp.]